MRCQVGSHFLFDLRSIFRLSHFTSTSTHPSPFESLPHLPADYDDEGTSLLIAYHRRDVDSTDPLEKAGLATFTFDDDPDDDSAHPIVVVSIQSIHVRHDCHGHDDSDDLCLDHSTHLLQGRSSQVPENELPPLPPSLLVLLIAEWLSCTVSLSQRATASAAIPLRSKSLRANRNRASHPRRIPRPLLPFRLTAT